MRRAATIGALLLAATLPVACIDAGRVNRECRWTDPSSTALDLGRAADREHLRQDAQLAWEIGQRYADVRYRHEPLLARPLLVACRGAMIDSIVARHAVSRADVERAMHARRWPVDIVAVMLPLLVVTVVVAEFGARELERTLGAGSARAVARVALGGLVAIVMGGLTQVWAMSVETWLLRNEHIAGRVSVLPSTVHPVLTLGAIAAVVAATLAIHAQRRPSRHEAA